MNVILLVNIVISALFVLIGVITGLVRGAVKSGVRLAFILISVLLTFMFFNIVFNSLITSNVQGGITLKDQIMTSLTAETPEYAKYIYPIIEMIIKIFLFVGLFITILILSYIAYCIVAVFVVNKKIEGKNKFRLIGAIIGVVNGLVIALIINIPLTGLMINISSLSEVNIEGNPIISADEVNIDKEEYLDSFVGNLYSSIGNDIFNKIATTTNEDGEQVTLDGQIEAFKCILQIVDSLNSVTNSNFNEGLTSDNIEVLKDVLTNINGATGDLSDEAKETINNIITDLAIDTGLEVVKDLANIDFSGVDFEKEAEILDYIYEYQSSGSQQSANDLVESLANSDLLLSIASQAGMTVTLSEEQKNSITESINNLENIDSDTKNKLEEMFKLN